MSGEDLVRSFAGESVTARLALVGPGYATDDNGQRCLLVRVRVTALTSSVSVNPAEFTASGAAGRSFASMVRVPGSSDQVRSPVQVAACTDFVGTLAFPDHPARQVSWLLSNGQPAASWDIPS